MRNTFYLLLLTMCIFLSSNLFGQSNKEQIEIDSIINSTPPLDTSSIRIDVYVPDSSKSFQRFVVFYYDAEKNVRKISSVITAGYVQTIVYYFDKGKLIKFDFDLMVRDKRTQEKFYLKDDMVVYTDSQSNRPERPSIFVKDAMRTLKLFKQ